jgi:GT2 family glycosyltransferase
VDLAVVIPTYRRPRELARTLDALEGQGIADGTWEVVVVDDPADDSAAGALERRVPWIRRVTRHAEGVAAARNAGWRATEARLIMFIGDDCIAAHDLVGGHLAWHGRNPEATAGVLGRVRWAEELRVTAFMRWLEQNVQFDYERIEDDEAGWGRLYTSNVSLKRELLERVGGFDEGFPFGYEDLDLGYRLHREGFRLAYDADLVVDHLHAPTLEDWERRMAVIARAERRFVDKHPELRPWFHDLLSHAAASPPARGRGARLAALVPRSTPWLGAKVWTSADMYFGQRLARPFLTAWDEAAPDQPAEAASRNSSGSPPGGPK